jgi:hypothetical protein
MTGTPTVVSVPMPVVAASFPASFSRVCFFFQFFFFRFFQFLFFAFAFFRFFFHFDFQGFDEAELARQRRRHRGGECRLPGRRRDHQAEAEDEEAVRRRSIAHKIGRSAPPLERRRHVCGLSPG